MALHLLKLCVGATSIEDLVQWQAGRRAEQRRAHQPEETFHTTRMVPKRVGELVDGGSLYWVIKGQIAARQALLEVRPFTDKDGIGRCRLMLGEDVTPVRPRPFRAFQGWRYLKPEDAPPDIGGALADVKHMPEALRRELAGLGLL
jgi:hypothetical protein